MNIRQRLRSIAVVGVALAAALSHQAPAARAEPTGYVRQTIPTAGPPVALAFDDDGLLYVLSGAGFGDNSATMQVFAADGSLARSFAVVGEDEQSFFVGGMTYDAVGDRLLVTDNAASGRIYAVSTTGDQTTLASDIPAVAGIAVRSSGEIVITTALGFGGGRVFEIDRTSGAKTEKLPGLDYGAGLAFDGDDLIVQDLNSSSFTGRLQRVAVDPGPTGLAFGSPTEILSGMSSAYGVALDAEGDVFTTGTGGVFNVGGAPAAETLFFNNGRVTQFSTAIAFHAGSAAFEPFAGPLGGVLAVTADGDFGHEDQFVTLFTPALAEDFNSDGAVGAADLATWTTGFGSQTAQRDQGDADGDQDVEGVDFLRWQQLAGASTLLPGVDALAASSGAIRNVPELASCSQATIGLISFILICRRRGDVGRRAVRRLQK